MIPLASSLRRLCAGPGAVWLTLTGVALLLGCLALLPASSPRAAGADPAAPDPAATGAQDAPTFGTATPSDKFVQSFQQQVSQQLQSSLEQSHEAQESRLRAFEQQQRDMDSHIQALEQSLAQDRQSARGTQASAAGDYGGSNVEPPHVNVRRAVSAEPAGGGSMGAGFLPALLGAAGEAPIGGLPGFAAAPGPAPALAEDRAYSQGDLLSPHHHASDANIAPHGFIEGRLLNGVVTQQGGPERESIVALSGDYQSANGFTANLNGCFALVQGRPEIATGRIDFKLSRLTCNFRDGASRTWDASGWLVDADGIRGVRAVIVDNTGKKAAVAAAGGAIGGIGQRVSQQQYDVTVGPGGFGASTSFAGSAARDALGGAATGGANALNQSINDYYSLYGPSLQVGGGTRVTVVLANDLRLPPSGREISQTHVANP